MMEINPRIKSGILLFSLFGFSLCIHAQSNDTEMEALFSATVKKEHRSFSLQYSNRGSSYYWIERDTLFRCAYSFGGKIALKDIDFSHKNIMEDNMLLENTTDNLYILSLKPLPGKQVFTYPCFINKITGPSKAYYDRLINLDMDNSNMADEAFDYLQRLSKKVDYVTPAKTTVIQKAPVTVQATTSEKKIENQPSVLKEKPDFFAKELWEVSVAVSKLTQTYDREATEAWQVFYKKPTKENYDVLKTKVDLAIVSYHRHSLQITNLIISPTENKLLNPLKEFIKAREIILSAVYSCAYYAIYDGSNETKLNSLEEDIKKKQAVSELKEKLVNQEISRYKIRNGLE